MIGRQSAVVAGQRVPIETMDAWSPVNTGPGIAAAPASLATLPPSMDYGTEVGPSGPVTTVGGYGTADNNAQMASIAAANPWSWKLSPLPTALLFFVVGVLGLKFIHWNTGSDEHGIVAALDHPLVFLMLLTFALLGTLAFMTHAFKALGWPGPAALVQHP